jgi:hypothetical protein
MAVFCQVVAITHPRIKYGAMAKVAYPLMKQLSDRLSRDKASTKSPPIPKGEGWGEGGFMTRKIHSLPLFRGLAIQHPNFESLVKIHIPSYFAAC